MAGSEWVTSTCLGCGKVRNQIFEFGIVYRLGYVRIASGSQRLGMKVSRVVS